MEAEKPQLLLLKETLFEKIPVSSLHWGPLFSLRGRCPDVCPPGQRLCMLLFPLVIFLQKCLCVHGLFLRWHVIEFFDPLHDRFRKSGSIV